MKITLVNQSRIADKIVQEVLRAINMQLWHDFRQAWGVIAEVELVGKHSPRMTHKELQGDAILYLRKGDGADIGALGYHDYVNGIPCGVVHTETPGENWTVTLSHEVLETILDADCNTFKLGPHPEDGHPIMHWFEACDACQSDTYEVFGVQVSDFLTPHYFTPEEERGQRLSYMGADIPHSFGLANGGYVGFYDPITGRHDTYARDLDGTLAAERALFKRAARYMRSMTRGVVE